MKRITLSISFCCIALLLSGCNANLINATRSGDMTTVRKLVDQGADVNQINGFGMTPLMIAIDQKNRPAIEYLIDKGADLNAFDGQARTPLIYAIFHHDEMTSKLLIAKGADIHYESLINGSTPLDTAAALGHLDLVQLLLEKGADVNHRAADGATALMYAVQNNQFPVVSYLLDQCASPYFTHQNGLDAFELADQFGFNAVGQTLASKKDVPECRQTYAQLDPEGRLTRHSEGAQPDNIDATDKLQNQPLQASKQVTPPANNWSKTLKAKGYGDLTAITADDQENLYAVGTRQQVYLNEADQARLHYQQMASQRGFGDMLGSRTTIESPTYSNIYLQKFNRSGTLLWDKDIAKQLNEFTREIISGNNSLYVVGERMSNERKKVKTQFLGRNSIDDIKVSDAFITKLDLDGQIIWDTSFGSENHRDNAAAAVLKENGNILVTGLYAANKKFHKGDKVIGIGGNVAMGTKAYDENSDYEKSFFVAEFSADGKKQWIKFYNSISTHDKHRGDEVVTSIKIDHQGNILVAGRTLGAFKSLSGKGGEDVFIMKLDPQGKELWVSQLGSDKYDFLTDILIDRNNNVILTGGTKGEFERGRYYGQSDSFVSKLSPGGELLWSETLGSRGEEHGVSLSQDQQENIILLTNETDRKKFSTFAKLSPDGRLLWQKKLSSINNSKLTTSLPIGEGSLFILGEKLQPGGWADYVSRLNYKDQER